MSLLSESMTPCVVMVPTETPDGYGGVGTTWAEGETIDCAFAFDNSLAARRAEKAGVKNLYTISMRKACTLSAGDHIVRVSDGKIFRITSDGVDKKTPASAALNMRVVSAEQIEILPT